MEGLRVLRVARPAIIACAAISLGHWSCHGGRSLSSGGSGAPTGSALVVARPFPAPLVSAPPSDASVAPGPPTKACGTEADGNGHVSVVEALPSWSDSSDTVVHRVERVIVGDGWGCAELSSQDDRAHQQCWTAPFASGASTHVSGTNVLVKAKAVPWLPVSAVATRDRLCVRDGAKVKCWPARDFLRSPPAGLPDARAWMSQGKETRLATGIYASENFECTLGDATLECRGSDDVGRLSAIQTPRGSSDMGWFSVALGRSHACFNFQQDIDCWGRGDHGELGTATPDTCRVGSSDIACSRKPLRLQAPEKYQGRPELVAGDLYTCAVWNRFVECWGASRDGFFGSPDCCDPGLKHAWPTANGPVAAPRAACSPLPVRVPNLSFRVREDPTAGPRGLCVFDSIQDEMRCVGAVQAPKNVRRVVVGLGDEPSACGINASGGLRCWGAGYSPPDQPYALAKVVFTGAQTKPASRKVPGSWDRDCIVHRGCRRDIVSIPMCERGRAAETWSALAPRAPSLRGQVVTVKGVLASDLGSSTLAGCGRIGPDGELVRGGPAACCNGSISAVVLKSKNTPLAIGNLDCRGDESAQCCNTSALGSSVVATGTLVLGEQRGFDGWILRDPTLCRVAH